MEYNSVVKIFGDVVANLSPEFCEKHFGKITFAVIGIVTVPVVVPAVVECVKYCTDQKTYRCCYKIAAENGLLSANCLNDSGTIQVDLPTTA